MNLNINELSIRLNYCQIYKFYQMKKRQQTQHNKPYTQMSNLRSQRNGESNLLKLNSRAKEISQFHPETKFYYNHNNQIIEPALKRVKSSQQKIGQNNEPLRFNKNERPINGNEKLLIDQKQLRQVRSEKEFKVELQGTYTTNEEKNKNVRLQNAYQQKNTYKSPEIKSPTNKKYVSIDQYQNLQNKLRYQRQIFRIKQKQLTETINKKDRQNESSLKNLQKEVVRLQKIIVENVNEIKQMKLLKGYNYNNEFNGESLLKGVASQKSFKPVEDNNKNQDNFKLKRDFLNSEANFKLVSQKHEMLKKKVLELNLQNQRMANQNQSMKISLSHSNSRYISTQALLKRMNVNPQVNSSISSPNKQFIPNESDEIKRVEKFFNSEYSIIKSSNRNHKDLIQNLIELSMKLQAKRHPNLLQLNKLINEFLQRIFGQVIALINQLNGREEVSKDIIAFSYVQLANIKFALHRSIRDIESPLKKGIQIYRKESNNYFEELIIALNNMALYYEDNHELPEAIKIYQELIYLENKYFEKSDERILLSLNNLACAYYENKQQIKGRKIFEDLLSKNIQKSSQLYQLIGKNYDHYKMRKIR